MNHRPVVNCEKWRAAIMLAKQYPIRTEDHVGQESIQNSEVYSRIVGIIHSPGDHKEMDAEDQGC